ncbi:hypothetical protein CRM22_002501 [Opisthorchis felineus]|uniref:MD-2-related lipid-recognition domain-containing protein n=1 Tax=Opisthorchis felineus TaxID=147828 RepID=A0A4V3SGB6_OPIFE|nr:hypothetical protein CRM22_002501 [Opisthorchis felineus]
MLLTSQTMKPFNVLMCGVAAFLAGVTDAVTFRDCGSTGARVTGVEISPCDSEPCALRRGVNYIARVAFKANANSDTTGFSAHGTVGSRPMAVPLPSNGVCVYLFPPCPIQAGGSYVYSYTGAVSLNFPLTVTCPHRSYRKRARLANASSILGRVRGSCVNTGWTKGTVSKRVHFLSFRVFSFPVCQVH